MVWFKVDDGLMTSSKVLSIPRRDRLVAMGLWCAAGAWSAGKLSDGFVPAFLISELGATPRTAQALVDSGLWHKEGTGFRFHDWADWQPTRDDVEAKREKNAEKIRNWRARNRGTDEGVTELHDGSKPVSNPAPDPTRPDPTNKEGGPRKLGHRLPENWLPKQETRDLIASERLDLDLKAAHQDFLDYWHSKSGQAATKVDWDLTWRRWMRGQDARKFPSKQQAPKAQPWTPEAPPAEIADDPEAYDRWMREQNARRPA